MLRPLEILLQMWSVNFNNLINECLNFFFVIDDTLVYNYFVVKFVK